MTAPPSPSAGALDGVRRHPRLTAVVAVYVIAFTTYGLVTGARLTVPYAVIVVAAAVGIARADARVRFSTTVLVGLGAWGFGHLAGGLIQLDGDRILYNAVVADWLHFDNAVHLVGFGTAGVACWEATRSWLPAAPGHRIGTVVVVCLLGMGVGAANEVVEFGASHALAATNVGGYENTGRDLVANLVGTLAAGWLVSHRAGGREKS